MLHAVSWPVFGLILAAGLLLYYAWFLGRDFLRLRADSPKQPPNHLFNFPPEANPIDPSLEAAMESEESLASAYEMHSDDLEYLVSSIQHLSQRVRKKRLSPVDFPKQLQELFSHFADLESSDYKKAVEITLQEEYQKLRLPLLSSEEFNRLWPN